MRNSSPARGIAARDYTEDFTTQRGVFALTELGLNSGDDDIGVIGWRCAPHHERHDLDALAAISAALTTTDVRRTILVAGAYANVGVFTGVPGGSRAVVIGDQALLTQTPTWGESILGCSHYAADYTEKIPFVKTTAVGGFTPAIWTHSYAQLRNLAADADLPKPWPRNRDDLLSALAIHQSVGTVTENEWPIYITRTAYPHRAALLVIRADGNGSAAHALDRLIDAISGRTLAVASGYETHHSGIVFYDARDESPAHTAWRTSECDWVDDRMAELAPVRSQLEDAGYTFYALGGPRDTDDGVLYFLNGSQHGPGLTRQPYGWYTLAQLADRKFVRDSNDR